MKQALVVLGMHRSGTSSLAGTLCLLGARAPKTLMPGHEDNPRGYWESLPVVHANDDILRSAGSSWTDWRPFNPRWIKSADGKAAAERLPGLIRDEFDDAPLILLKDPRICRLFPLWKDALDQAGYQPLVVIPLRSPMEVAASLGRRDGFSQARALMIWLRHVLEAERSTRSVPRHFLDWPAFIDDWRMGIAKLGDGLDLALPGLSDFVSGEVDVFLDGGLRRQVHERPIPSFVPQWIDDTRQALLKLVEDPSDKAMQATLDGVRSEFDATAKLYGPVLAGLETERRLWREEHDAERQDLTARLTVTTHERDVQMIARADTEALLHQYMASSGAAEERVVALELILADERQAHALERTRLGDDAQAVTVERDAFATRLGELETAFRSAQDQAVAAETALESEREQASSLSVSLVETRERLAAADRETLVMRDRVDVLRGEVERATTDAAKHAEEVAALRQAAVSIEAAVSAERIQSELEVAQLRSLLADSETALASARSQLTEFGSQGLVDRLRRKPVG